MELYFFRPEEHHRLYGCIDITVQDVPLEKRKHVVEGLITIVLTAIYYTLYIPCLPSIYRHIKNPCYKLLFYISIVDCSILWVLGFAHGYFAITGAVFCSHPTFIYFLGCHLVFGWICESSGQLCLVINRSVAILSPRMENTLFGGKRIYLWIGASILWGTYWLLFVIPVLFTGIYFSWFSSPYVGYRDELIDNKNNSVCDQYAPDMGWRFFCSLAFVLLCFFADFFAETYKLQSGKTVLRQQKMMLIQVSVMSVLNFASCFTYVTNLYFAPSEFFMHFEYFCWFHIHGLPPIIYLLFNATIRNDTKKMFKTIFIRNSKQKIFKIRSANNVISNTK